jgi:hypothetical protein
VPQTFDLSPFKDDPALTFLYRVVREVSDTDFDEMTRKRRARYLRNGVLNLAGTFVDSEALQEFASSGYMNYASVNFALAIVLEILGTRPEFDDAIQSTLFLSVNALTNLSREGDNYNEQALEFWPLLERGGIDGKYKRVFGVLFHSDHFVAMYVDGSSAGYIESLGSSGNKDREAAALRVFINLKEALLSDPRFDSAGRFRDVKWKGFRKGSSQGTSCHCGIYAVLHIVARMLRIRPDEVNRAFDGHEGVGRFRRSLAPIGQRVIVDYLDMCCVTPKW